MVGQRTMPLTQIEIRNAKPGMHAGGNGLYLTVKSTGTSAIRSQDVAVRWVWEG